MRYVLIVCQYELQRMPARRQRYGLFCLSASKMEMVGIVGHLPGQWRRVGVDNKVVVPGIRLIHARRGNTHVFKTEDNGESRLDHVPIMGSYDVSPRSLGRWPSNWIGVRLLGGDTVFDKDMYDLRYHWRIVWKMPIVAEKQLQCVLAGAQRKFGLRLTFSEVQVVEVARDFPIHARERRVNEKVVVAAIGPSISCMGYFYPARAEPDDRLGRYV